MTEQSPKKTPGQIAFEAFWFGHPTRSTQWDAESQRAKDGWENIAAAVRVHLFQQLAGPGGVPHDIEALWQTMPGTNRLWLIAKFGVWCDRCGRLPGTQVCDCPPHEDAYM